MKEPPDARAEGSPESGEKERGSSLGDSLLQRFQELDRKFKTPEYRAEMEERRKQETRARMCLHLYFPQQSDESLAEDWPEGMARIRQARSRGVQIQAVRSGYVGKREHGLVHVYVRMSGKVGDLEAFTEDLARLPRTTYAQAYAFHEQGDTLLQGVAVYLPTPQVYAALAMLQSLPRDDGPSIAVEYEPDDGRVILVLIGRSPDGETLGGDPMEMYSERIVKAFAAHDYDQGVEAFELEWGTYQVFVDQRSRNPTGEADEIARALDWALARPPTADELREAYQRRYDRGHIGPTYLHFTMNQPESPADAS